MWSQVRYNDGDRPKSPQGVVDYIGGHLQATKETGTLAQVPGYLNKDGLVDPIFDEGLWRKVGWDGKGAPPERLIRNLTQGCDLHGRKLTQQRSLFRPGQELVITMPSELSEATRNDPKAAHAILVAALSENIECLAEGCVRQRSGKGRLAQPEWAAAVPLTLEYIHQRNRADEVHGHAHVFIFPVALGADGTWRTFDNGRHMARLSKPGGGRDRITKAIVQEAARHGYRVELEAGRATGGGPQGARVTCPDGRVIEAGSVERRRRAEILAAQEMRRELGLQPLTRREIEWVRKATGRIPAEYKGAKRQEIFEKKLHELGLLDPAGRVRDKAAIDQALGHMEAQMALAQASLQELTLPHAQAAAEVVKGRRRALVDQVPGLSPNTNSARIRWTETYDQILELVQSHPSGLGTHDLDKQTRDNLSKLKRAGILNGDKVGGRMVYTLSEAGQSRLLQGRTEQQATDQSVRTMVNQALHGAEEPGQVRGRLESLGIQVRPTEGRFELGAVGRSLTDPELMEKTSIQANTPSVPDRPWWKQWWDRRHELPGLLRQAILSPVEWARRWPGAAAQLAANWMHQQAEARRKQSEGAPTQPAPGPIDHGLPPPANHLPPPHSPHPSHSHRSDPIQEPHRGRSR